jgi:arginase
MIMVVTQLLGVPIDSVGAASDTASPFGTEQMPGALRSAGLASALAEHGVTDDGDLAVRVVDASRDPVSGLVGWPSADAMTRAVRETVAQRTSAGERVLLLGGCCALLPGAVAGIRDALGTVGVVNIDGHLDLYDETTSPTGEIADVPIAALLGLGVAAMQPALSPPVLRVENVALVGYRDADEAQQNGSVMPTEIALTGTWDVQAVKVDAAKAADDVIGHLGTPYWVHLDLDVLDEQVLPATDYLMPGGLTFPELSQLLRAFVFGV